MVEDLLSSYEKDFSQHIDMLEKITASGADITNLDRVFDDCQKLIKQIDVESMNYMSDDNVRIRVS